MDTPTIDRDSVEALLAPIWAEDWPPSLGVGDGWLPLIDGLARQLIATDPNVRVQQIKVKFGGLRFYAKDGTARSRDLIRAAEAAAGTTCENCGNPGRSGDIKTWAYIYCGDCAPEDWVAYDPSMDG